MADEAVSPLKTALVTYMSIFNPSVALGIMIRLEKLTNRLDGTRTEVCIESFTREK